MSNTAPQWDEFNQVMPELMNKGLCQGSGLTYNYETKGWEGGITRNDGKNVTVSNTDGVVKVNGVVLPSNVTLAEALTNAVK